MKTAVNVLTQVIHVTRSVSEGELWTPSLTLRVTIAQRFGQSGIISLPTRWIQLIRTSKSPALLELPSENCEPLSRHEKILQRYLQPDLLIVDDMGKKPLPNVTNAQRLDSQFGQRRKMNSFQYVFGS